jgi:hypothetical protein
MAISFFQKIRLMLRGRARRRDERDQEFLQRNVAWVAPKPVAPPPAVAPQKQKPSASVDREGLQVAFLDDSGRIVYYLDVITGEVVEHRDGEAAPDAARFKRVPRRSVESDAADRQKFIASLDVSAMRDRLALATDGVAFRRVLSADRALERSWYVFKNDAATAAIDAWLKELGDRSPAPRH